MVTRPLLFLHRWMWVLLLTCASVAASAADFSFKDLQGKTHRLADYKGKWVLINFWATWCPPCLHEIPELLSLQSSRKDIQVIGLAMDSGTAKVVAAFAKKQGITYPVVMSDRKIQSQIGEIDALPTSYLYSPQGKQVSYKVGEITRESIETYIKNYKPK
ncbi:MAG: TlpA disulfide reductase family protein [Gallionella sp.]